MIIAMTAKQLIKHLNLAPHPEGGWYRQTWKAQSNGRDRSCGTAIIYLLEANQRSHWHCVDADEIWHFYAGAPLDLLISPTITGPALVTTLGQDILNAQTPQAIVPKTHWQAARTTGAFSLVGCTVSPGFEFAGFTLAPPDFDIPVKTGA